MSFTLSVVTGPTGVTGLTNPTWTMAQGSAPAPNQKQYYVSSLGGTQPGVSVHGISNPFTITATVPTAFKQLGSPNANGVIRTFPKNYIEILARKGVLPQADQNPQLMMVRVSIGLPAGADIADPVSVASCLAMVAAVLWGQAEEIRKTVVTGGM